MAELLDDFLLVSDDDIRHAIGLLVEKCHTLAEGAGAAGFGRGGETPGPPQGQEGFHHRQRG